MKNNVDLLIHKKSLSPKLVWYNYKIKLKSKGSCLKQEGQAAFIPKNGVFFYCLWIRFIAMSSVKAISLGHLNTISQ